MAAPTFVQEVETAWSAGQVAKTTVSFNGNAGDILVIIGGTEDRAYSFTVSNSGAALTWTQQQFVAVASYGWTSVWTATLDTTRSLTVTGTPVAFGGTDRFWGFNVLTYRSSDGVGASSKTNAAGAPSLGLTTTQADSAIVAFSTDWNAVDGLLRTWRTVNGITPDVVSGELTYARDSTRATVYGAAWSNAGAAGAKTVGLSAPAGQAYAIVAVEVKGTGGGANALAGTVASSSTTAGALAVTAALTGTVASASTVAGTVAVGSPLAATVASTSTVTGTLAVSKPLAGTVASTSTAGGALDVTVPLTGTVASSSTLTGTLTNTAAGQNALAGTIASTSTVSGALLVSKPLAGTVAASSSLTGLLSSTVALAGTITSTSTTVGALTVAHPLAGTITSTSTITGAVVVLRPLAGQVIAASTASGTLTNTGPITAVGRLETGVSVAFGESAGSSSVYESTSGVLALNE